MEIHQALTPAPLPESLKAIRSPDAYDRAAAQWNAASVLLQGLDAVAEWAIQLDQTGDADPAELARLQRECWAAIHALVETDGFHSEDLRKSTVEDLMELFPPVPIRRGWQDDPTYRWEAFRDAIERGGLRNECWFILLRLQRWTSSGANPGQPPTAAPTATGNGAKWTRASFDAAFRKYACKYSDLIAACRSGRPGAKKEARNVFGRNAVRREFDASASIVSGSSEWRSVADECGLLERRGPGAKKLGHEIAMERQAIADGHQMDSEPEIREAIRLAESLPAKTKEDRASRQTIVDGLMRRTLSVEQANEIIDTLKGE